MAWFRQEMNSDFCLAALGCHVEQPPYNSQPRSDAFPCCLPTGTHQTSFTGHLLRAWITNQACFIRIFLGTCPEEGSSTNIPKLSGCLQTADSSLAFTALLGMVSGSTRQLKDAWASPESRSWWTLQMWFSSSLQIRESGCSFPCEPGS